MGSAPDTEPKQVIMAPPTALNAHAVADTEATAVPSRLTINEVPSQRAKAGKLNGGVAAATSSDLFKFPVSSFRENSLLLCGCVTFLRQFAGSSFCVHNHWLVIFPSESSCGWLLIAALWWMSVDGCH